MLIHEKVFMDFANLKITIGGNLTMEEDICINGKCLKPLHDR